MINELGLKTLPTHIAFVVDGNGRWAKARGKSRSYGHKMGAKTLEKIVEKCKNLGIKIVSVFAFSTENWKRSEEEIAFLMNLLESFAKRFAKKKIETSGVKFTCMGNLDALPKKLSKTLNELKQRTAHNTDFIINLGINYGGRDELLRAVNKLLATGKKTATMEDLQSNLDTFGLPDPDFVIRTSGEERLSNFMLFQMAYSELYFPETYWPAFNEEDLIKALKIYDTRKRRFGAEKEQK